MAATRSAKGKGKDNPKNVAKPGKGKSEEVREGDTAEQRENRIEAEWIIAEKCIDMGKIKRMLNKLMSAGPFDIDLMQRFTQYGSEVEKQEDEELDRQLASSSEDDQELETAQGANRGLLGRFTPWRK